jgi:hypothetical protein
MKGGVLPVYFPLVQVRTEQSLSVDTLATIKAITLDPKFPSKIVGSFQYAIHEYPGDIDLMEEYVGCCSVAATAKQVVEGLQQIIENVKKRKLTFLGDFKAGIDKRFDIELGEFVLDARRNLELTNYDATFIKNSINLLYNNDLLPRFECDKLLALVKDAPSYSEHQELLKGMRNHSVLRWTIEDIQRGYKVLRGNVKITLAEAVTMQTVVKIDVYVLINNRFVEVTNWFLLKSRTRNGKFQTISASMGNYEDNVLKDIAVYKNPQLKKHMKLAKRMWLYAVKSEDIKTMRKLFPLFSSGIAKLSQIVSDIETLCNMFDKLRFPPIRLMVDELQDIKMRMGTIMNNILPIKSATKVYNIINTLSVHTKPDTILKRLRIIEGILDGRVNRTARAFLLKAKLL